MEPSCEFGLQYRPLNQRLDPVARMHVTNCRDCRQQVRFI